MNRNEFETNLGSFVLNMGEVPTTVLEYESVENLRFAIVVSG